jgi:hypothetical protein
LFEVDSVESSGGDNVAGRSALLGVSRVVGVCQYRGVGEGRAGVRLISILLMSFYLFCEPTEVSIKATDGTVKCILNVPNATVGLFYKA